MGRACSFGLCVILALLILPQTASAQTAYTSAGNGWWHVTDTWAPPGVPGIDDDVVIRPEDCVSVRFPVVARSIVNRGIINHPEGSITEDRRVRVLLMVSAIDSLINYGEIRGFNSEGEMGAQVCPTSVLLTIVGGEREVEGCPGFHTHAGQFRNHGVIRGGLGYLARYGPAESLHMPGGSVVVCGRPAGWLQTVIDCPPGADPWTPHPDVVAVNLGTISGGDGGSSGIGGGVLIGWRPWQGPDWPELPFSHIENRGLIQGGQGTGWVLIPSDPLPGGSVMLMSSDSVDVLHAPPGNAVWLGAGKIDTDGGEVFVGKNVVPGFEGVLVSDTLQVSGTGTRLSGAWCWELMGWWDDPFEFGFATTLSRFTDLDAEAIHAVRPRPFLDMAGGFISSWGWETDLRQNASGTAVLRAEDAALFPPEIAISTHTLLLDDGVALQDITDPASDPFLWKTGNQRKPYQPAVSIRPIGTGPDTTIASFVGDGLASSGDTIRSTFVIRSNQRLEGTFTVSATDSLGYYILNPSQIITADTFPFAVVEVDVKVPYVATIGTRDRLTVGVVWSEDPSVKDSVRVHLHVVPTVALVPPYEFDGFQTPVHDTTDFEVEVRNEGKAPGSFTIGAWAEGGWPVLTEFGTCYLAARSDTSVTVRLVAPPSASPGDTAVLHVRATDQSNSVNFHEVTLSVAAEAVSGLPGEVPGRFALEANVPNPFNPSTAIRFALPCGGRATLIVYDVSGRRIAVLADNAFAPGLFTRVWGGKDDSGTDAPSGIYFARLQVGEYVAVRKMVLLR